uniref:Protein RFT1 homolog n=1 Tax=Meloidogyne hapla TaxID=6305 RepID=A0A1I8BU57_MELHA
MNNSQGDQLGLTLAYTIVLFELCVDLIGLPISSLNFYAISKTSLIHWNLKFILLCQSGAYLMRFTCKLFIAIPIRLFGPFILWHESENPITLFLFYSNVCFRTFLSHTILLERTMATVFARKYEKSKSKIFSVCWFSIAMFVVSCNAISQQLTKRENGARATVVTLASSYTLFILLLQYNKKKLIAAKEKEKFEDYKLTERYQASF